MQKSKLPKTWPPLGTYTQGPWRLSLRLSSSSAQVDLSVHAGWARGMLAICQAHLRTSAQQPMGSLPECQGPVLNGHWSAPNSSTFKYKYYRDNTFGKAIIIDYYKTGVQPQQCPQLRQNDPPSGRQVRNLIGLVQSTKRITNNTNERIWQVPKSGCTCWLTHSQNHWFLLCGSP
jgi:hypothetical protein